MVLDPYAQLEPKYHLFQVKHLSYSSILKHLILNNENMGLLIEGFRNINENQEQESKLEDRAFKHIKPSQHIHP
jgi:hypothetical protein